MNKRYRIAMIAACPFPAARGTPTRIFHLAKGIAQRGHEVDVYTYHLGEQIEEKTFHIKRTFRVGFYTRVLAGPSYLKLLLLDPLLALNVAMGLSRKRYDVIHAHHFEGLLSALPTRLLRRVPVVFDVHTMLESELPSYKMGLPKRFLALIGRSLDRFLPRYADHVIAVSDEIYDALIAKSGIPDEAISVVPSGVEPEFLAAYSPIESRGRDQKPCLVYAGGLAPYQGIDLLLSAFARARRSRSDLTLRMITASPFGGYEAMATKLGVRDHIEIMSSTLDDLPNHLAVADVAVNPRTTCDGLPQKLLNYMAVGCPIVSFAGSAKFLRHEETGLIVPDDDTDAFADAILRLLSDRELAHNLGRNARVLVRREFSWVHSAERIEAVYSRLLDEAPRAQ
jgi:glycosyltransferase involved in cell wall biosynthesis